MKKLLVMLFLGVGLAILMTLNARALSPSLLITRVQAGGAAGATEEFVEVYNQSPAAINVVGWRVEYLSAAGNLSSPALAVLSGVIPPGGSVLLAREGYLPEAAMHFSNGLKDEGGHVRVRNQAGNTIDMIGWGNAAQPEGAAAPAPARGQWLERKRNAVGDFMETDNNSVDFGLNGQAAAASTVPSPAAPAAGSCDGIILSEILPNPAGTDKGHEFIELYNPLNMGVQLGGCSLLVGGKTFALSGTLQAGQFQLLYDTQTGLALPNAAGGEVTLITQTAERVVQYPPNLKDNEVWALIDTAWQSSELPTPGAHNQLPQVAAAQAIEDDGLSPCPEGKYRNPETNRCKANEITESSLSPCKAGQIRNPATNRCVSALGVTASSLTPCSPGQERNPATNRCRSVLSAVSSLKPCDSGEERNPETNRCKKTVGAAASASSPNTGLAAKAKGESRASYGIVIAVAVIGVSYGIYEYRVDLRNKFVSVKARMFPRQASKKRA